MEKTELDKLTTALGEAGFEVIGFEEERLQGSAQCKTGNIFLRIIPVKSKTD